MCIYIVGRCAENAAALPEHRFLAAIFLTDDIMCVLRSCDDDDNEHVLLSKITRIVLWRLSTAWCWPPSSPGSRASCLVCVWRWLGRQCVPGPHTVQSTRLQLQVCAWQTLHVGSLDRPSSCTSLPADARCFCGGFSGLRV